MAVTAQDVNALRQRTGAGMIDCKKALEEAVGDMEKAVEILRKKGQKISESRQDRDAKFGSVFIKILNGGKAGIMFELNCETDFVERNDDFQALGNSLLEAAATHPPADLDGLKQLTVAGQPVENLLLDAMAKIGEKISLRRYAHLTGDHVESYVHPGAHVGVLVAFSGPSGNGVERDVAIQVASMAPLSVDKDGVDATLIERELEIGREQARAEGKPEAMLDKIAQGKLQKFYKERTLLQQEFVKDPSMTIEQLLKKASADLKVLSFRRMRVGAED